MEQPIQWNSHYTVKTAPLELNQGDKVILPSSALEQLLSKIGSEGTLPSPLTFKLKHPHSGATLHCGVKEFSSNETNTIQLPTWMMEHLQLTENDHVLIQLDILPKGTWTRLRPISNDYRDIQDYRAALEAHLRSHYHTLSKNQILNCRYGGHTYQFQVMDVKPQDAVSITDTDLEVDLDPIDDKETPTTITTTMNDIQVDQVVSEVSLDKDQYQYYRLVVPENTPYITIQCQVKQGDIDIVASSSEKKPTIVNHEWSDLTSSGEKKLVIENKQFEKIYIGFRGYSDNSIIDSIKITTEADHDEPMDEDTEEDRTDKVQCDNCHQWILKRTMPLHEGFCRRNNVVCEWGCGKIFKKDRDEFKEHWHCEQCDYVGVIGDREKHVEYFHTEKQCVCQQFKTTSYTVLAEHCRTVCPEKLIFCRYCHILTAQGVPSLDARDRLLGLHSHESYCGSRTIVCQKCNKPIPIKDIQVHAKIHEIKRQQQVLPPMCCNRNCIRPRVKNKLSFCQFCFGPFWITEDDPKNQKLIQRVARKIHSQLTIGCGNEWCRNKYCATFTKDPKDATTAASLLIPMIKDLSRQLALPQPNPELYFCVDESTTKKRFFGEIVFNETKERYDLGWCIKAVEADQDIHRAVAWLEKNAPRKNHQLS